MADVFDEQRLCRLIELMKQHDLREIDLQEAEQRIRLKRNLPLAGPAPPAFVPGTHHYQPLPAAPPTPTSSAPPAPAAAETTESESIVLIKSPMVGTFYARPNPNSPPFVKVGDHVDPEKTICIIEAMKVFNEIPAEVTGRIVAVLAQDEEAVEFGKPLFKVDTKG